MNKNNKQTLCAIVLAAGLSRRMGADNKLILPFRDTTILGATLTALLNSTIAIIVVVIGHQSEEIKAFLTYFFEKYNQKNNKNKEIVIVQNADYQIGMTTSIQKGILNTSNINISGYMICLADMPLILAEEYNLLQNYFFEKLTTDKAAIVQPVFNEKRGNPTLFSFSYKEAILANDFPDGCKPIVTAHQKNVYLLEMPSNSVLKDIDFREDYEQLIKND
jgi:molybdenum cofactor cytidylyltransferase